MIRRVDQTVDFNAVAVHKSRATLDAIDAFIADMLIPPRSDIADVLFPAIDQPVPVGPTANGRNTETGGIVNGMRQVRRIPHDLLRHTTVVDARTSDAVRLDDSHFPAQTGCLDGYGKSTTATTYRYQIIVLTVHIPSFLYPVFVKTGRPFRDARQVG